MIFEPIAEDYKKAGISIDFEKYKFLTLASTLSAFLLLFALTYYFSLNLMVSLAVAALSSTSVFLFFYVLPSQIVETKKKKIEDVLYFATSYMATIAGTGLPPHKIFETMAEFKEFGEINRQCKKIVEYMKVYGLSLPEALEKVARNSPSPSFREVLWGIKTIITAGGDLQAYLLEKSNNMLYEYKRRLEDFSHRLAMLLEIYTTVVIVGSIFAIVLSAVLSFFGAYLEMMKLIQVGIIVGFLPIATAVFVMLFKYISPGD